MRTEHEVIATLTAWAERSDNIRALRITGSRARPSADADELSDYDIEVFVRDRTPFISDESWITEFGTIMVRWPRHPASTLDERWITQLVLYHDGVRIDFQITDWHFGRMESLGGAYRVLTDKDGALSGIAADVPSPFGVSAPDAEAFADRVNAFWWDIVYVAKALCRSELNYAKYMLDGTIRYDKLQPLIEWYIGTTVGWGVSTGMCGRWFHRHLSPELWQQYVQTFAGSDIGDNWRALFATIEFARTVATSVAKALSFDYPHKTDADVSTYIEKLHCKYTDAPSDRST